MNARDFLDLQNAYQGVYQELDEATAMAKRGYDETKLRQRAGGGEPADRATSLENQPTYGDANKAKQRQNYARAQRGDFRKTASSKSGLHGYAHKSNDPAVKAKQDARGKQRGALTPNEKKQLNMEMEYDTFDAILEHLVAEGYADTNESALAIMANMSEEWREEILDERKHPIMTVTSPTGETRSKKRPGATVDSDYHRHEKPDEIDRRRFSQQLSDAEKKRKSKMDAGRLTVATKRGIEKATNRSNDGPGGGEFAPGSALRRREEDDQPTDYRARKRRASGR